MTIAHHHISVISLTIFHITDINTLVLSSSGAIQLNHKHDHIPDFLADWVQEDIQLLCSEAQISPRQCCKYTNAWGFTYLAKQFHIKEERPKILVTGPFLLQVPDVNPLYTKFKMDQQKWIELESFYRGLKLISASRVQSMANIFEQIETISQTDIRELELEQPAPESPRHKNIELMLQQPDEAYIDLVDLRYQIEQEMTLAVQHGDQESLQQVRVKMKNLYDFSDRFPNQPVRTLRNALIILNTLLRVAAKNVNVQPFFLHQISEKFAKLIERTETIDSLNKLMTGMFDEYCKLVRLHAVKGYSPLIQKAIQFVSLHYNKPFTLEDLSHACHAHPAHISRQFKKKTGMTVTQYQQKRRIEESKPYLKKGDASIKRIAETIGFDDAGYFTRIFKKLEGMTPTEYQKS
ncbi:helix-turn-helix transcriptional regulator [Paenibacillus aceris]|uniref:AraC-like DNA-binding protein n=1 Tax=Paenibacillus aceris TaxID=869555 RepID=A0ABS4HTB1_9BACL|nr:AraC family transcriptional regulator [Paenibacillus aceris]MBP1961864.1 AraC-like DNA-binding protein [Paenibacillus aceris]NHW34281.1 helix-turn-helix transcriptional regulator [Paenibacillus aceris]